MTIEQYDPDNPKMLGNWFDPHNLDHLAAYKSLCKDGHWPEGFFAEMKEAEVVIHSNWIVCLLQLMADAGVAEKLSGYCLECHHKANTHHKLDCSRRHHEGKLVTTPLAQGQGLLGSRRNQRL